MAGLSVGVGSSNGDVHGFRRYATLVGIVTCHHDVTVLPPGRAPAVLQEPVVASVLRPVANHQQRVRELGARAAGLAVHPIRVELNSKETVTLGTYVWSPAISSIVDDVTNKLIAKAIEEVTGSGL